jgi:hypothetical protein
MDSEYENESDLSFNLCLKDIENEIISSDISNSQSYNNDDNNKFNYDYSSYKWLSLCIIIIIILLLIKTLRSYIKKQ